MNAQIVTLGNGTDWVTFSTVKGSNEATMFNSHGEKLVVSLDDARARTGRLVRAGWTVVRSLSLRAS